MTDIELLVWRSSRKNIYYVQNQFWLIQILSSYYIYEQDLALNNLRTQLARAVEYTEYISSDG